MVGDLSKTVLYGQMGWTGGVLHPIVTTARLVKAFAVNLPKRLKLPDLLRFCVPSFL